MLNSSKSESAQTFLVKTYQKLILTPEEKEMDIFDVMEKHFPINTNPLKEQREYNLRISILEIAHEIGCIDAATSFLNDHSNRLAQLSNYHKALAEIYYSQSKQAA